MNILYHRTSADSKSSRFSVTANIHDRLIDDSISLPRDASKQTAFPSEVGELSHTQTHTPKHKAEFFCRLTYVPPFCTHKHTCVLTGWSQRVESLCLFFGFHKRQTNSTTLIVCHSRFTAGLSKTYVSGQSRRMLPVPLVRVCECVCVCGDLQRRGQQIPLQIPSRSGTNQITKNKKTNDGQTRTNEICLTYTPLLCCYIFILQFLKAPFVVGGCIMVEQDSEYSGMR